MNKIKKVFKLWVYIYAISAFLEKGTQNIVNIIENNIDEQNVIDDGRDKAYMTHVWSITCMNIWKIYLYSKRGLV